MIMTHTQQKLYDKAMRTFPPNITNDPYVNYIIDKEVSGEEFPYDEKLYFKEITKLKELGLI